MTVLGGCPVLLPSNNMRQLVQKILEGKNRQEQDAYRQFRTYFLVDSNFCNPASGNEKGSVENLVGFAQRNIVGPRMEAHTWAELNEKLWQNCLAYGQRRLRGGSLTVYERWQREQALLRPLPSRPFDCGRVFPVISTGIACVQFETNRYSVPLVCGLVHRVRGRFSYVVRRRLTKHDAGNIVRIYIMQLKAFRIENFRCLHSTSWICLHDLTAFIGENDGGKSTALDALACLLNRTTPTAADYSYKPGQPEQQEDAIQMFCVFSLNYSDKATLASVIGSGGTELHLHKEFRQDGTPRLTIICSVPADERYRQDIDKLTVAELKELAAAAEVPIPSSAKKAEAIQVVKGIVEQLPHVTGERDYPASLLHLLPRVEVFASSRAPDPQGQVLKVLRSLFQDQIRSDEFSGKLSEIQDAIAARLNDKVSELQPIVQKYYHEVEEVSVSPTFDFASGLTGAPLQLKAKGGAHIDLNRRGDGKRRQVTLAVYEWQSELLKGRDQEGIQPLILALDEPDTHLDYEAQRKLFDIVMRFVQPSVQVIVCTHSMNLIDRLPATKITHFSLNQQSVTVTNSLTNSDEKTEELFLNEIGRNLGLTTGTIFHERCFLIVEGETEFTALPVLSRYLYRSDQASLQSRGVKLLNGENNAGARHFARFLKNNGRPVLFLVDEDYRQNAPSSKLFTEVSLTAAGFDSGQVFFIGTQEFEDAFSDDLYTRMANRFYPKTTGSWWREEFTALRAVGKFSDRIKKLTASTKPEIGYRLAQSIEHPDEVPAVIKSLFEQAIKFSNISG